MWEWYECFFLFTQYIITINECLNENKEMRHLNACYKQKIIFFSHFFKYILYCVIVLYTCLSKYVYKKFEQSPI